MRFSIIYKAIWMDGPIKYWSVSNKKWIRYNDRMVALKSLNKSLNLSKEFLNKV